MDKNKESELSPEIAKLTEKLAKDPSSKLFVPLAEEYRKSGMLDEAIQVLSGGLKANPNYMTARVSLGKMLLEKGNISEAQEEFEKVVKAIPDNLFAHKKLAEIYQSEGNRENLLKEYKIILSLSPKDEEVKNALDELEGRHVTTPAEEIEQKPEPEIKAEIESEIPREAKEEATDISIGTPVEELPVRDWEKEKVTELEEEAPAVCVITPEELPPDWEKEKAEGPALNQVQGISAEEAVEEIPAVESEILPGAEAPEEKEEEGVVYELPEEAISPEELGIEIPLKMTPVVESPRTKEMEAIESYVKESLKPVLSPVEAEEIATDTLAEIYIKQGLYEKADEIYRQILISEPENMVIRQKREELQLLLNLTRGKESVSTSPEVTSNKLSKLEAWLKNIKERRR